MLEKIRVWLSEHNYNPKKIARIRGDASFRSFYRVTTDKNSYILMFLDPSIDSHEKFINSSKLLTENIRVPKIIEHNPLEGWLLLEDFGDITFKAYIENTITEQTKFYRKAIDNLIAIQKTQVPDTVKPYDIDTLNYEMDLFIKWFYIKYKKKRFTLKALSEWERAKLKILESILEQTYVLVHRDYHSRNLMILDNERIGVIDHQDILWGPITYDLASLLKDVYVELMKKEVDDLLKYYYKKAKKQELIQKSYSQFEKDFDIMGLQRHLKILGLFCRLSIRDSKHKYLDDLPLTEKYVLDVVKKYKNLSFIEEILE